MTRDLGEYRFVGKGEPLAIVEVLGWQSSCPAPLAALAARFTAAMSDLRGGDWSAAGAAFAAIVRDYPDDGAARFHLERCRQFASAAPAEAPWLVHLDAK